jgi:hypothetical protein
VSQSMPQIQRCPELSPNSARLLVLQPQHFPEQRKGHPMSGSPGSAQQCPAICVRRHDWLTEHLGGISPRIMLAYTKPETVSGGVGARPILKSPFAFHLMCIPRSPTAVRRATDEVISPSAVTSTFDMPRCSGSVHVHSRITAHTRPSLTRIEESAASEALAEGDRMSLQDTSCRDRRPR